MDTDTAPQECTFTCFPNLPTELRLTIWHYASSIPRNIDVWLLQHSTKYYKKAQGYGTTCRPPPILHANQESRAVGLEHYELSFSTKVFVRGQGVVIPRTIYVNWTSDVIVPMSEPFAWFWCFLYDALPIQNLARNISDSDFNKMSARLFNMPLRNIILYRHEVPFRREDIPIWRIALDIELVPFDQAVILEKWIADDVKKMASFANGEVDLKTCHAELVAAQERWDGRGRPLEHHGEILQLNALRNRLPCPRLSLAEMRVNRHWKVHQYLS